MLLKRTTPIAEDDTTGSLTPKLARLGALALLEALPLWVSSKITPVPQDNNAASYTHKLQKEDGELPWAEPAALLARTVRAYTPWPGAYTHWRGKLLKIISARAIPQSASPESATPGTVSVLQDAGHKSLLIATGDGSLLVTQLQLEGKKAMSAEEFLRGYPQIIGETLQPHSS